MTIFATVFPAVTVIQVPVEVLDPVPGVLNGICIVNQIIGNTTERVPAS